MKKAFTLIELLIVIAIIGILAGILFVSIGTNPLRKSRDTKRTADLQNLRTALTLYYSDNQRYPTVAEFDGGEVAPAINFLPAYLASLPNDPSGGTVNATNCAGYTPNFGGGDAATEYGYRYAIGAGAAVTTQAYVLGACLEMLDNVALDTDCDNAAADPTCFADGGATNVAPSLFDIHS